MEQMRPLEYTIKIYGEGFTEWFYFDGLRTNNRFRFSMVPEVPKNSRSSYKQNLKLIDKELKKKPQERADALFLVIDTDTLVNNKEQYNLYLATKEKYKKQGVIFIESHPCIELWFLYHLYGLSALLYTMVKNQQILVCDELDSSLHYDLFTHILKTFLVNSERGQLIFSTHNLMLLDEEYIRRDMVYFANKNQSGATEVYRAKDFGLHKEVSILNAYRAGKLGAKPNMGSIFMND